MAHVNAMMEYHKETQSQRLIAHIYSIKRTNDCT